MKYDPKFYQGPKGEYFLVRGYRDVAHSPDGATMYDLAQDGYNGRGQFGLITKYKNPATGETLDVEEQRDFNTPQTTFYLNGVAYPEVPAPGIDFAHTGLPRQPQPRFLVETATKELVYFSINAYPGAKLDESGRLFVGKPNENMREIPVVKYQEIRDGGTVIIETAEGTLGFSPPDTGRRPSWAGQPVTKLEVKDFDIEEGSAGARVTPKQAVSAQETVSIKDVHQPTDGPKSTGASFGPR